MNRSPGTAMNIIARLCLAAAFMLGATDAALAAPSDAATTATDDARALPRHLRDTGLFVTGSMSKVRAENLPFSPQYPLWSDGAAKRRWFYLPPGTTIDASQPDAWEFPRGTRLWKQFSQGHTIETRFIERRTDGSWQYGTYIWNADGSDAVLAPVDGTAFPAPDMPSRRYAIPAEVDCRACHEAAATPVLGFSALQLSPDRDPLAPHAEPARPEYVDLRGLVARGLIRNLPAAFLEKAPRIAAPNPTARAALGYLHGNCGHCHNSAGPLAPLDLVLAQEAVTATATSTKTQHSSMGTGTGTGDAIGTGEAISEASRFRSRTAPGVTQRIVPGRPDQSVLAVRMQSRDPLVQMPPLGTQITDPEGMALVARWINQLP